ncbi:acyltransferase family protein [Pseudomonas fluorescens]|uniref:acyltransferase family protein n=1 Tax=Pseudomonas fluorescens TaxID=294 RepID=UPI003D0802C0
MNGHSVADSRLSMLDGWRGISILLVLASHLLPLGPKHWQLNSAAGVMGMAIFFTLSGFLITSFLLSNSSVVDFLIRRIFRIVPLAWLYMAIALLVMNSSSDFYIANFLFIANWPPMWLGTANGHLWSLCVEVQFYVAIAMLVVLLRNKWVVLIPLFCIAVTMYRVMNDVHVAINTYYRIDEILAGCILALIHSNRLGNTLAKLPTQPGVAQILLLLLFALSCHPDAGFMNYFRPYLAAALVGSTLLNSQALVAQILNSRVLFYIATISYALYVVHPLLEQTWLGSGETVIKYLKRPLLFAAVFLTAHISTFYYEKRWIAFGKTFAKKVASQSVTS